MAQLTRKKAKTKTKTKTSAKGRKNKKDIQLSIVMPCLNEEETLAICIEKAQGSLKRLGIKGEVVIADNGSTDRSVEIAESLGARVVHQPKPGYGNAYQAGLSAAYGKWIIMGDSDDSYDFSAIDPFVEKLGEGYELVMGTRLKGKIMKGAMPPLHRYLGNPILSWFLNVLFKTGISDSHCGMRGFTKQAFEKMKLRSTGMEFASEMVINSAKAGLNTTEVPITLHPDGRTRAPHLRSFRDGWRHLRFMLMHSPKYLFFAPGLVTIFLGALLMIGVGVDQSVFGHVLDTHFLLLGGILTIIGFNIIWLGFFAVLTSLSGEFETDRKNMERLADRYKLEYWLFGGVGLFLVGFGIDMFILISWILRDFGPLDHLVNLSIFGNILLVLGIQQAFSSFFLGILQVRKAGYK